MNEMSGNSSSTSRDDDLVAFGQQDGIGKI